MTNKDFKAIEQSCNDGLHRLRAKLTVDALRALSLQKLHLLSDSTLEEILLIIDRANAELLHKE